MESKEKIVQTIKEQLDRLSFKQAISVLGIVNLELTKKLINAEVKRIHVETFKATYPPEFWKLLQEEFPDLQSY